MSELLKEIIKRPGMSLTEFRGMAHLKRFYTQKKLDAEYSHLKKTHQIYETKTKDQKRKAFVWKADFVCSICTGSLPACKPSLRDSSKCSVCDYETRRCEDAPNNMMNLYAVKPIVSYQTQDPRGYYGVSR